MSTEEPRYPVAQWVRGTLIGVCLACNLVVLPCGSQGETPASAPTSDRAEEAAARADELADKKAALATELSEARQQLDTATGDAQDAARQVIASLEALDRLYAQQGSALKEAAERASERTQIERELNTLLAQGSLPEPPPYALPQLDSVRDELESEIKRATTIETSIEAAQEALQQATEAFDKRERARREARELLETNRDPTAAPALERTLRLRQLDSRVAGEQVRLRELQLKNARLAPDIHALRLQLLRQQAEWMAAGARFSRDNLQEQLAQLDTQEANLKQALAIAELELGAADRQWIGLEQQLDAEEGRAPPEEIEARRRAQQARQLAVSALQQQLQWIEARKQLWQRRYLVHTETADRKQLAEWARETRQALEELDRDGRVQRTRLADLTDARTTRDDTLATTDLPAATTRWISEQRREIDAQLRLTGALLASLEDTQRLHDKLLADVQTRLGTVSLAQWLHDALATVRTIWRYEIGTVDDRPITVSKLVVGLLLFSLGLLLSGYLSRQLGKRMFPRLGLDPGASAALQSLSFYALVSLLTLLALNVINVPLTAFTLAGGALAIGLGFGSQNIVNNFISGLILLVERPIRIGDMIEVDGTYGVVEQIGARSTRVRSFSNIHIIVPNSSFLEKNVINWTLSDDQIRTQVTVGVAYGSPTRTVMHLIRQAVDEHEYILKVPEPTVIFTEFGDNALIFDVYFWIRMRKQMDRRRIESDIRHRIDELFREAEITIAFPQRDVHVDSLRPFEVRLVPNDS